MKISKNIDQEYELLIQTTFGDFICDSYPLDLEKSLNLENVDFFTLYAKNIFLCCEEKYSIHKTTDGYFSYKITGKYIGDNKVQIDTCVFHIDSPIPKDIEIGNFVSFEFLTSSCCI